MLPRTRWGSVDNVEAKHRDTQPYQEKVFRKCFAKELAQRDKRRVRRTPVPGADAEQLFRDEQKTQRCTMVDLAANGCFKAQVLISLGAKVEVQNSLLWMQKRVKEQNASMKEAASNGTVYLGPTPLSKWVCGKAAEIDAAIGKKLDDQALTANLWGNVWALLPEDLHPAARQLIVTTVLTVKASFQIRVIDKIISAPLLFLLVCEAAHDVVCERRQVACRTILDTPMEELDALYMDFSLKMVQVYRAELLVCANTGLCPHALYVYMIMVRRELGSNTQDIEGMNSLLQRMTALAPNCRMATASDRMQIKKGEVISAEECVGLHTAVVEQQRSHEYMHRFSPVTEQQLALVPAEHPAPPSRSSAEKLRAVLYARSLFLACGGFEIAGRTTKKGAAFVYEFLGEAFLASWTLGRTLMLTRGAFAIANGVHIFRLRKPLASIAAVDFFKLLPELGEEAELRQYPLEWSLPHLGKAVVDRANMQTTVIKLAKPPRQRQPWRPRAGDGDGDDNDGGQDEGDEDEDPLKRMMEAIMEEEWDELMQSDAEPEPPSGAQDLQRPENVELGSEGSDKDEPPIGLPPANSDASSYESEPEVAAPELAADGLPETAAAALPAHRLAAVRDVVAQNLERLQQACQMQDQVRASPLLRGVISLIAYGDEITFVTWTEPENRRARRVRIDQWGRMVSIVAFAVPNDYFRGADIIIQDTKVTLGRATRANRPTMPDWCLLLWRERLLQQFSGPMPADSRTWQCVVCKLLDDDDRLSDVGDLYGCSMCQTAWHTRCACRAPFGGMQRTQTPAVCPFCRSG